MLSLSLWKLEDHFLWKYYGLLSHLKTNCNMNNFLIEHMENWKGWIKGRLIYFFQFCFISIRVPFNWIFNSLKNYWTTSTICWSERTAFVVFLEKSKVWVPLIQCFPIYFDRLPQNQNPLPILDLLKNEITLSWYFS